MDLAIRWHRLLRALAFLGGLLLGLGAAVFIFSNLAPIDVHWRIPSAGGYVVNWSLGGVSLWLLAIVPLLVGAVVGYFYQTPARMHHVREAMRHRHRVHELEHELKQVRTSLDQLLLMPEDDRPAVAAALISPVEREPATETVHGVVVDEEPDPRLPDEPAAAERLADSQAVARGRRRAGPRRGLLGGLKEELANVKLPGAVPAGATIAAHPRNGKSTPVSEPAPKVAHKSGSRPRADAHKPS